MSVNGLVCLPLFSALDISVPIIPVSKINLTKTTKNHGNICKQSNTLDHHSQEP